MGGKSETNLTFRVASMDDVKFLYDWRNDFIARQNFLSSNSIIWENHCKWLSDKLSDPNCKFYILINHNQVPVGQVRIDIKDMAGKVNITIDPEARRMGYGSAGLKAVVGYLSVNKIVDRFTAFVKKDNVYSQKIFASIGFLCKTHVVVDGRHFIEMEKVIKA